MDQLDSLLQEIRASKKFDFDDSVPSSTSSGGGGKGGNSSSNAAAAAADEEDEDYEASDFNFSALDSLMDELANSAAFSSRASMRASMVPSAAAAVSVAAKANAATIPASSSGAAAAASTASSSASSSFDMLEFSAIKYGALLGEGHVGKTYQGKMGTSKVVIKELLANDGTDVEAYYRRHWATLRSSAHPNIVKFLGITKKPDGTLCVVSDFFDNEGTLINVCSKGQLPWKKCVDVASAVARGMAYFHGRGVIHLDLKSSNILIGKNGATKICDLGLSRPVRQTFLEPRESTSAPEVLKGTDYTSKADSYSFGIILAELINGAPVDVVRSDLNYCLDANAILSNPRPDCPKALITLAKDCLKEDPASRPSTESILESLNSLYDALNKTPAENESNIVRPVIKAKEVPSSDPDAKQTFIEEVDNVFIRRRHGKDKIFYSVDNKRPYDIRLEMYVQGHNACLRPIGDIVAVSDVKVYGNISTGTQAFFATVEAINRRDHLTYDAHYNIERIDTEIQVTESDGVFLTTRINHGTTTEVIYEVFNKRQSDVEVEINAEGSFLPGSSDMPMKSTVFAGEKKDVATVYSKQSLSMAWRWKELVAPAPDEVSEVKGVRLTRRFRRGLWEFQVENTRPKRVEVTINVIPDSSSQQTQTIVTVVDPSVDEVVGSVTVHGKTRVDWNWTEVQGA